MQDSVSSDNSVYRMLFENAGDAIFVHDANEILAVNKKACETLGYTEAELLSMSPNQVDSPEMRMYMPERMAKLKKHKTISFETTHQGKDGTKINVEVTSRSITWDAKPAIISICRDNTKKKYFDNIVLNAAFEWQHTFDSINDAVFLLSKDHRILRCNKASYLFFNKTHPGEIIGRHCWEVVHGTSEPLPTCPIITMGETKKRETSVMKSGERWLEITADPVLDENNNISGAVHIVSDITGRKRAEEALERSELRYHELVNLAVDGILLGSHEGIITEANEHMCVLSGRVKDQLVGKHISTLFAQESLKRTPFRFDLLQKGETVVSERKIVRPDSSEIVVEMRTKMMPDGTYQSIYRDITERRRMEDVLSRSEEKYRKLHDSMIDAFILVDMNGKIKETNRSFNEMLGYSWEELSSLSYKDLTPPQWHEMETKIVNEQILDKGHSAVYDKEYRRKDGTIIPVELRTSLIRDENGAPSEMWAIVRDLTERKRNEMTLKMYQEHLEELVQERTTALRESERKYRELVENTNSIILRMDKTGKVTFFNEFAQSFFGYTADEIIGKNVIGTIVPRKDSSGQDMKEMILDIGRHTGKYRNNVNENLRKDGERVWIAWTNKPIFDDNGHVIEIMCIGNDITGRVKAERELEKYRSSLEELVKERTDELKKSQRQYCNLVEGTSDLVTRVNMDGCFMFVNHAAQEIYGLSPEECIGRLAYDFIHPEDREATKAAFQTWLKSNEEVFTYENRMLDTGGRTHHLEWLIRAEHDEHGNVSGFASTARDVSERKKNEEALKSAFLYSRNLIETSLDPLVTISKEGKITDVNTATEKITGISRKMLIGSDFADYFTDPEMARAGYMEAFENGKVTEVPLAIRHVCGSVSDVLYNASVYRNEKGEVLGVFAAARDVTEHKRLEAEKAKLEEQNRQLQKAESLDRMAGAISHHFNNQLHVVMGYLGMAMGELPPDNSCATKLSKALQAARKASEVSSLLLTYLGQIPGKLEMIDLAEICRTSLPILQAGKPKNVTLETDLPFTGPVISADTKQIQHLLTNLVINAWEAIGDKRGTILLKVGTVSHTDIPESHRFPVEWRPHEHPYACLEVFDSGCGIKEEDVDKIFDPFFSTKFTGRGLGLSSVLGIVRAHDSVITEESGDSGGSVFRVFFPITAQKTSVKSEPVAVTPKLESGGTVLLVEDEEGIRRMTEIVLAEQGYAVLQAKDGVEAVKIFNQHKDEISCLLCDLTMPRMGGWETISALRAVRHDLPVILASGYDEASVMAGEHPDLPDCFLNKPYDLYKLGDTIEHAIAKKKAN